MTCTPEVQPTSPQFPQPPPDALSTSPHTVVDSSVIRADGILMTRVPY
jgi:hypothetical protein